MSYVEGGKRALWIWGEVSEVRLSRRLSSILSQMMSGYHHVLPAGDLALLQKSCQRVPPAQGQGLFILEGTCLNQNQRLDGKLRRG